MLEMKINLNQQVLFRLNEECRHSPELAKKLRGYKGDNGYYKMQLWDFMHDLGPYMTMGFVSPIKDMEIIICADI